MIETLREERLVGGDAKRCHAIDTGDQLSPRLVACCAVTDDLGDHRIVERRNFAAGFQRVLHA